MTRQIFSEQGIPEKIISDNGGHFDSEEYREMLKEYGIDHTTSSPRYPRSNSFVERFVETVKSILHKAKESKSDPYIALLCLRTTPVDHIVPSPMELLYGRKGRCNLPTVIRNDRPNREAISERLEMRQQKQKEAHDIRTKPLHPLIVGQPVLYQEQNGLWAPGRVIKKCEEPRSYLVRLPNGGILKRNRHHLRDCMGKKVRFNDPADKHVDTRLEERGERTSKINRRDTGPVNNSPVTANNQINRYNPRVRISTKAIHN